MEATTEISIIKVSDRGAYLITDGTMQAWTRPSSRRADGLGQQVRMKLSELHRFHI